MSEKTCPCTWCGRPTKMLGTKLCDPCWELERRVRMDPLLAARMLAALHKDIAVLLVHGKEYVLNPRDELVEDGKPVEPVGQQGAGRMARLAFIREALKTAETSLL